MIDVFGGSISRPMLPSLKTMPSIPLFPFILYALALLTPPGHRHLLFEVNAFPPEKKSGKINEEYFLGGKK
jgi:hypothetical protein